MKKFILNICVLVVLVFVGFTTYYVVRNDEDVKYSITKGTVVYLNLGETFAQPFVHSSPAHASKVDIETSGTSCYYDETKKAFITSVAGTTDVTLTPTNKNFPSLTFTVKVGSGSVLSPYYIRNEVDLQKIGKGDYLLSDNYELVNDIVLTKDFAPIGSDSSPFNGTIFGGEKMYKIKNLKIIDQNIKSAGLFASIGSNGRVERLTIDGMQATGDYQFLGAIAGKNYGLIGQCKVENTNLINKNKTSYTGGICGLNQTLDGFAQVSLCTFVGDVSGYNYIGGLIGTNLGGIVTNNKTTVNSELLSSTSSFGGLAGYNSYSSAEIDNNTYYQNSIIINNLSILNNLGASGIYSSIIGLTTAKPLEPRTISYFNMCMTQAPANIKAIQKNVDDSVIQSNDDAQNHYHNVPDLGDKKHFSSISNSTWSFDGYWKTSVNSNSIEIDYMGCLGSYQDIPSNSSVDYLIKDESSLILALDTIRKYPSANLEYKITKSINLDFATNPLLKDKVFAPIGNEKTPFMGKIYSADGAKVTISNAKISYEKHAGFFGVVSGANTLIQGINIKNINAKGEIVGALVGLNLGATIKDCNVSTKQLQSTSLIGGIVGINQGTLNNCDFTMSEIKIDEIDSPYYNFGFIAGQNSGNIEACESSNISINLAETSNNITYYFGGIAGQSNGGSIKNCIATGMIGGKFASGTIYAGGLIGRMEGTQVESCIVDSFTIDFPKTKGVNVGGIASFTDNKSSIKNSLVQKVTLAGHRTAGFASDNSATINESAVGENVSISGRYVGGFAIEHNGSIKNSYTLATLKGDDEAAGFVLNLNKGSEVRFCYNFCSYIACGKAYCETSTPFRASQNYGTLLNCVVVGKLYDNEMFGDKIWVTLRSDKKYDDLMNDPDVPDKSLITQISPAENETPAIIQKYKTSKGSFKLISSDAATGVSGFAEFAEAGFDSNIWNYDITSGDEEEVIESEEGEAGETTQTTDEPPLTPEEILQNKLKDIYVNLAKCFTLVNLPKIIQEI